jgi:lytic cellulose monooxygenase (C1-hydroxylating)
MTKSLGYTATLLGAFASSALAHGTVTGFVTDGIYNGGFLLQYYYQKVNGQTPPAVAGWSAENLDNGFVDGSSYTSADIICHKNAEPGATTAKVAAGGTIEFQWTTWPDSHFGPVFTYIANCNGDCSAVDKSTLKFVKIDEGGINLQTQEWAATAMIANNNTWVTTVPSNIAPGNYVFRHEIIAMHAAGQTNGAQNYPQCFNVEITGSGTENPVGVLATELYSPTDPGILFNPYTTITSYTIPGPALFGSSGSGGSGNGNSNGDGAASTTAISPATTAAPVVTATSVSTPPAAATTAPADPSCNKKKRRHARDVKRA